MNRTKYITTTLPYLNSKPHIGHCFEFVLADVIAEFYRLNSFDVIFNVGVDEHGQKIFQQAKEKGFHNVQTYCDDMAKQWENFCDYLSINYDNFYRTTDPRHAENVLRYYNEIKEHVITKTYKGKYCLGCEAYVTDKDVVDGKCPIHKFILVETEEENKFFQLSKFNDKIKDILVDKSRSTELENLLKDEFDLSITRQSVEWGIDTRDGSGDVFYVWFEALLNYIFAIGYYENPDKFKELWENSLIICGKDNLKFQAYILQAILLANDVPQTAQVLVHGNILDEQGQKMSKSIGNVIDPIEQVVKYGADPLRYYLLFGLNITNDSKYSEAELVAKWNSDIVNGLGNLISRLLHLIDIKGVELFSPHELHIAKVRNKVREIKAAFEVYDFHKVGQLLNGTVDSLNKRISEEKPYDKDCPNASEILNEIFYELRHIISFYRIVLKENSDSIGLALRAKKKAIIFKHLEFKDDSAYIKNTFK